MSQIRTRWAAVGAAVAVTLGAGGIGLVDAAKEDGARPVYTAITTCRILDTRPLHMIGVKTDAFEPEETLTVPVWGDNGECTGIPDDVVSVQLNVTAVDATELTHFTFWPDGDEVPNGSSLNPTAGEPPAPNAVTVDLSDTGSFNVFNFRGNPHLIIDLVGIYQDHTHDDRYYTEDEVDAVTDEIWGHWVGGALAAASPEGVDVQDPDGGTDGVFCVVVPARDTLHGFQATGGAPGLIAAVDPHDAADDCAGLTLEEGQAAVAVFLNDADGVPADGDFTFFAPASGPAVPEADAT
jgi:hypothetical protein